MVLNFPMPRWTAQEDAILRAAKSLKDAERFLAGRSRSGIKSRRAALRIGQPKNCWKRTEDNKIRKYAHESSTKIATRLKDRTRFAVHHRRKTLGVDAPQRNHAWFGREVKLLEKLWPLASRNEIIAALPRHPWLAAADKAKKSGFIRLVNRKICRSELREAVRKRAREDGISLRRLGYQIGIGDYLVGLRNEHDNYDKIARAVEFFGGRLVIDWQDE